MDPLGAEQERFPVVPPHVLGKVVTVMRRIVVGHQYDIAALHRMITEELGAAGEWTLDDAPIDVLIPAKRLRDGMPWYFVRDNPANACRAGRIRLRDAVTASAAAPTFFAPWTVDGVGELVDGGIGVAGNPVYQACVEAFLSTPFAGDRHVRRVDKLSNPPQD